jgi:SOS-response transcriptional repressor LexA
LASEPGPRPSSKGELRRQHLLNTIKQLYRSGRAQITLQELQENSGIRSFNTLTRQLLDLKQQGMIEWDRTSSIISLNNSMELSD